MPSKILSNNKEVIDLARLNYAHGVPEKRAGFKQEISDFCVDEELGYELTGTGEHLCIKVLKVDLSTAEVVSHIENIFQLRSSDIGYSGMKDKRARCTQWFSLQLSPEQAKSVKSIENENLEILDSNRNSRKIKIGSHKFNHFRIRLRDCLAVSGWLERRLQIIATQGVPNYFGPQRFGRQMSNIVQVNQLMERQNLTGSYKTMPRKRLKRGMLFSAARAYLFNQLLSLRVGDDTWNRYLTGDVLNLNGTARFFTLQETEEWNENYQQRLNHFDIHPSGPLYGIVEEKDRYVSKLAAAEIETGIALRFELLVDGLKHFGLKAARRPLRFVPAGLTWKSLEGRDLELSFSLGKGAYATSLLRELCVTE
jgi:tRNA pseudouridine13 synthase